MAVQGGLPSYSENAMLRQLAFLAGNSEAGKPSFPQILTAELSGLQPRGPLPPKHHPLFGKKSLIGEFSPYPGRGL